MPHPTQDLMSESAAAVEELPPQKASNLPDRFYDDTDVNAGEQEESTPLLVPPPPQTQTGSGTNEPNRPNLGAASHKFPILTANMVVQAEILAQKLSHYMELHTMYCDFLRTDPTKMQRMFKTQTQDPDVLQVVDPYYFKDVDGLLAKYDEALVHVPKTYEECAISHSFANIISFKAF
jgi:hypothetical protein